MSTSKSLTTLDVQNNKIDAITASALVKQLISAPVLEEVIGYNALYTNAVIEVAELTMEIYQELYCCLKITDLSTIAVEYLGDVLEDIPGEAGE